MASASRRQLGDLFKEHGSWDAVVEARPDLADEAREAQQQGERLARAFQQGQVRELEQYEKTRRKSQAVAEERAERRRKRRGFAGSSSRSPSER